MKTSANNFYRTLIALFILPLLVACNADVGTVTFNVDHVVGSAALEMDTIQYTNAAGNEFSIEKLQYYLSGIVLTGSGDNFSSSEAYFIDITDVSTHAIKLQDVPAGSYTGVSLIYGVDPAYNTPDGLEATLQNINMAWPAPLGGGYHHMKCEGHYYDSSATYAGFAMHMGRVDYEINFDFPVTFEVAKEGDVELTLTHDLMEWHQSPANWDFDIDGVSIMADLDAQLKLHENGADVLTLSK